MPSAAKAQVWEQASNPVEADPGGVRGYEAVDVGYTVNHWNGLERSGGTGQSFLDGSVDIAWWWYAVASKRAKKWGGPGMIVPVTELYVWVFG